MISVYRCAQLPLMLDEMEVQLSDASDVLRRKQYHLRTWKRGFRSHWQADSLNDSSRPVSHNMWSSKLPSTIEALFYQHKSLLQLLTLQPNTGVSLST
ncbi:hypothetical protein TNCV_1574161 [Trichonephila clavipes]|nr:hypothetical protein TNCV_1574161 [Trichonephila clavipes]